MSEGAIFGLGHRAAMSLGDTGSRQAGTGIDNGIAMWEYSHMETTLVKADDKGRVCIRGTRKGAKYLVTAENGGWWIMPAPKVTVPEKLESPAGAWELRSATLESFYDKSKAW